ncbi:MAG: hypothetical protein ACREAY_08975 [Nitrososphaera sp.]|uniref:hypothetical protein n=1 Tax=Nitrososphaera sp. TaxID=1971748 RepID=UPI003D6F09B3
MASGRNPATSEAESTTGNILTSALDMLKVEDAETRKKAVEFLGSVSVATVNAYGKWITSVKAVADACTAMGHVFSQSELCDFLAVAAKGMDSKRAGTKAVNDATFYIYMDVMENYQKTDANLRLHYPRIIIDLISILDKGVDTRGGAVGVYGIERYYQERKVSAPQEDPSTSYVARPIASPRPHAGQNVAAFGEGLVDNLSHVTGRAKKDLEQSLSNLQPADIKKVTDLSMNYKRLQKYSKLTKPEELKKEVEKDLGRKLTDNQLQHAVNSIRKTKIYIENVLDGKFVPHGTHGINHVKHNLEYGYQLMGLIEPRRRRAN